VSRARPAALAERLAAAGLDWIVPDWAAPHSVGALTTTRSGGVSDGPRSTMDLGGCSDNIGAPAENRRRLRAFLPAEPRWLWQVHGSAVAVLGADTGTPPPVADAAVTRQPGVICAVRTADCLPVLFADGRGTTVGVAHAGWRGMAEGVLENTVAALENLGVRAEDLLAWLGPAIGPAAFEVGADVHDAFVDRDAADRSCFVRGREGKWQADLYGLARRRLAAAGVGTVGGGGFCTRTDEARFFSWRRERDCGRMATVVWLAPDPVAAHV
jgi:YfiH family protein